jgi:hypothetical protein
MSEEAAYRDGVQDGALGALAPALGVEHTAGQPTHTLMGRRFKVTIEWLDGPLDPRHEGVARKMAERAVERQRQRGLMA